MIFVLLFSYSFDYKYLDQDPKTLKPEILAIVKKIQNFRNKPFLNCKNCPYSLQEKNCAKRRHARWLNLAPKNTQR